MTAERPFAVPHSTARAYAVWSVGVLAFSLTVMHRTTLGVAGIDASQRLDISPSALSAVVLAQTAVFLALQIPSGFLVDRWGSRTVLVGGALLIALGQACVALASDLPLLVAGRVLIGVADSLVLVGTLALVPRWFSASQVPLMTQLTTLSGQIGQVLSAVPFLYLLNVGGWTAAFSSAAVTSLLCAVLVAVVVRDHPGAVRAHGRRTHVPAEGVGATLRTVWHRAGTRMGFFTHLATQFPMMAFSLLWGVPYLTAGQGLSPGQSGVVFTVMAVATFVVAPLMGLAQQRYPRRRTTLALGATTVTVLVWTVVLLLPPPVPAWLLIVLALALALGGPASVIGFDLARTANPPHHLGLAQSVVNTGGFTATLAVIVLMGVVLDATGGYTPGGFRLAWMVMYPFWALGVVGVLISGRRATNCH